MKHVTMMTVAALVLAGAAYPLFALDSHKKSETPVVEQQEGSTTPETLAKDDPTPAPAPAETAEATTEEEAQLGMGETVADEAEEMGKDKTIDAAKDATSDAAPAPKVPTPATVDPVKNPTSGLPKN